MSVPLGSWPAIHALRFPESTALIDADTGAALTHAELDALTTALAAGLRSKGVLPGDRVALLALNSVEMLALIVATARAGAIGVLINFRLTAEEVRYILSDSGAVLLFASSSLMDVADAAQPDTGVREVIALPTAVQRSRGQRTGYHELVDAGSATAASTGSESPEVDPDSLALLMYTSGTTGQPKGAIITHANLFWASILHNYNDGGFDRSDVCLASAPLFHIGALAVNTIAALYWGASSVVMESFDPGRWAHLVEHYKVTRAFNVPVMWGAILSSGALDRHTTSTLRASMSGGAACPITIIEALRDKGLSFSEGYGLTETTAGAAILAAADVVDHAGSIGRPCMHVDAAIVDPLGEPVPVGQVGELAMRGPNISPGYWRRPEATAEAFRDGWFYSGDLATVDEDGYYRIVDRKKDMVITGGENVYPTEIEQVLYRHPRVSEVSVYGLPDEQWGEAVTAAVVVNDGEGSAEGPGELVDEADRAALAEELRAFARERLAGFKIPKRFVFLPALPRTATGKVRKVELRRAGGGTGSAVQR